MVLVVYVCVCPLPVKTAGGCRRSRGCRFGLKAECQQKTMIYNRQTGTWGQRGSAGLTMRSVGTDKGRKRERNGSTNNIRTFRPERG